VTVNSRAKGTGYEREVAGLFIDAGFDVRGLESSGDHLIVCRSGLVLHSECKRAERVKLEQWWLQAVTDAPHDVPPVLTFRKNHMRSRSILWTEDLLRMIR
jgi:Holliday junction resolvase